MLVYLALGSNIGARETYLRSALAGLSDRGVRVFRSASLYWTEPKDVFDQPWFLNTVIEGTAKLEPSGLLDVCLAVERENRRLRSRDKGPRTLDIDIIYYGDQIIRQPGLEIPHSRLHERRFVLEPLAELAADFTDPLRGMTVRELLARTQDTARIQRHSGPLL
jgi:2-amino-4-hydroxy-6-hydroxymethyldihydropteridine diphosphokinase